MGLFDEAARNLGLMFHNIGAEIKQGKAEANPLVHEHSRTVKEEQPAPGIIIRRTTVEEIILAPGVDPSVLQGANETPKNPHSNS